MTLLREAIELGTEPLPLDLPPGSIRPEALDTQDADEGDSLIISDGIPSWGQVESTVAVSDIAAGGTGITSYAKGDVIYAIADNVLDRLSIGSTGDLLIVSSGLPSWSKSLVGDYDITGDLTIVGNLDVSLVVTVDTINEHTSAAGVTIDGVLVKDNFVNASFISAGTYPAGDFTHQGHLLFSGDNTFDIGASGATRPRTIYLGTLVVSPQLQSTIVTGTAPLIIASTTLVTNLNSDLLDGKHESSFADISEAETITGLWTFSRGAATPFAVAVSALVVTNLDADKLDGSHASAFSLIGHVHSTADITSGTFADARIAESNVTQHEAALSIAETQITDGTLLARVGATETITAIWAFNGGTSGVSAPFTVDSTFLVTNLNSDLIDGIHIPNTIANVLTDHDRAVHDALGTGTVVFTQEVQTLTDKTLTTPTIGSFVNAQHSHLNAAGGGTLTVAALTDHNRANHDSLGTGTILYTGEAWTQTAQATFSNNIIFSLDNTHDIGASGVTRPRTLYLGTDLIVGNAATIGNGLTVSAGLTDVQVLTATTITASGQIKNDTTSAMLLGHDTPATGNPRLDVLSAAYLQLRLKQSESVADQRAGVSFNQRDNTALGVAGVLILADASANRLRYGGGTSAFNAATVQEWYTGGTLTTPTGSLAADLTGVGSSSLFDLRGGLRVRANQALFDIDITFGTDNAVDIGASGASRPRTIYVGTSLIVPTVTATTLDGTIGTAAQPNITSLGTLTVLQVDNININGNTISSTAGVDLLITPLAGQQIVLDGAIVIDAGVVTGATSITSTAFVGALTGNASTATALETSRTINSVSFDGTANITVTAAAGTLTGTTLNSSVVSSSLTSVGTLIALTVAGNIEAEGGITVGTLGGATRITNMMSATVVWDIPSTVAGGTQTTTVTVTGAAIGEPVFISEVHRADNATNHVAGYVSSADTVTLVFINHASTTQNPGSRTIRVVVFKF